ncbi:hypothetical protein [Aquamicrobium soli]|uniref:Uncharacterized protein n=1 Tax=Aquamicrobium soli TaxID=1811518 RepID=A0ABV7KCQ0_9HYPH
MMAGEREILATPPKIAISVLFDTVTVELICGDEYAAQVTYEDIVDRLQRGEGLTLSVKQAEPSP